MLYEVFRKKFEQLAGEEKIKLPKGNAYGIALAAFAEQTLSPERAEKFILERFGPKPAQRCFSTHEMVSIDDGITKNYFGFNMTIIDAEWIAVCEISETLVFFALESPDKLPALKEFFEDSFSANNVPYQVFGVYRKAD